MARVRPRLTKLEIAFTISVICSLLTLLCFIAVRFGLYLVEPVSDLGVRTFFAYLWIASIVLAAIVGSAALIGGRRLFMVIPFLYIGYMLSLFSIILMTPYSSVDTLHQLLGAQLAIYAAAYLFWLALLKIPLPRLRKSR